MSVMLGFADGKALPEGLQGLIQDLPSLIKSKRSQTENKTSIELQDFNQPEQYAQSEAFAKVRQARAEMQALLKLRPNDLQLSAANKEIFSKIITKYDDNRTGIRSFYPALLKSAVEQYKAADSKAEKLAAAHSFALEYFKNTVWLQGRFFASTCSFAESPLTLALDKLHQAGQLKSSS